MRSKIVLFLFVFSYFVANIHAAEYVCPGESVLNIDGASNDANAIYSEDSTGSYKSRYFQFTPSVGGEMTISYGQNGTLTEEKQTFIIGTSCDSDNVYKQTSGLTSDSATFYVAGGQTYYVRIQEKNGNDALRFTANFEFKAIKIGFENAVYSIAEDINLADNDIQALALTLKLTHPATFDISVTYSTMEATPQSAISEEDFRALVQTVTFAAGETEKTVYIDIIHDVPIELEENFFVQLSNITVDSAYANVVSFGNYNPTEIIILEQNNSPICYDEDFSGNLDTDWRLLYSQGGYTPQIVNERLRMTSATGGLSTAMTKDYEFAAANNLISIEFDHFAYNGSGADGFAIVLYDSSIGASPAPGAFGGSLGYAQKCQSGVSGCSSDCTVSGGCPGFEGGWLGLGLDEFGNYSNPTEGRIGGTGFISNAVAIRGQGSGQTGYTYLAGTSTLNPVLWSSTTNYSGGRFRMTVDSRDPTHLYITLERDSNRDGTYESVIINKFDAIGSQGASPEYVRLAVTASTGGSNAVHELDDLLVKGVCRAYYLSLPDFSTGFVDAVDTYSDATYTDANGPDLTTKISTKDGYNFDAVYLGSDGTGVETYAPTGTFDTLPLTVEITLSDSTCTEDIAPTAEDGTPYGWAEIFPGESSGTTLSPLTMPSLAMSDSRLKLKALDWNSLFNSMNVSNSCKQSSTHGSLCGVPACLGSALQANEAFPPEDNATNEYILTACYGLSEDGSGSIGADSPCQVNNYTANCGGVKDGATINPPEYSNKLGCLACIMGALAESTCSVDHFALRPSAFLIDSSESEYPDLMRAAQEYNTTITAVDYGTTTPTQDYNQTSSYISGNGIIKWNAATPRAVDNTLNGAVTLGDFNITNGTSTYNGISGEVASVSYSDVGFITLHIEDINWSAIDSDDTTGDCSETGRYICGDKNVTFIPHHFSFVDLNITNNDGNPGTFTYLANLIPGDTSTYSMAARITTRIEARNKLDAVTENFRDGEFYENPLAITIYYNDGIHSEANASNIIPAILLGFGVDNGDLNGTRTFLWNDDSNLSKVLRFNIPRVVNIPTNPFDINGSDLNITIASEYTGTAPIGTVTIQDDDSGIGTASGKATMAYGRSHASKQRYEITTDGELNNANIYYETYCFGQDSTLVDCNTTLIIPFSLNLQRTDDIRWYRNTNHVAPTHGMILNVSEKATTTRVNTSNLNSTTNPSTVDLSYDASLGYPYQTTMEINASQWLIYDPDNPNATRNEFQAEFNKMSTGWSGEHETNSTTNVEAGKKANRRISW
ncbi:Calx-beta domain-containing protein [Sulfurimonas microaerophilic]|uniref:Calx-beta domain-containing protein n=1 Tax=Sulfurimonas microaerophilic TaxID=3058392 RepID=UPI00271502F8|nr:Calx-beta domain-containing protein [Sulfurimonas sp. hsl 1-7]